VADGAETADVAFDRDIMRGIGDHHRSLLTLHQGCRMRRSPRLVRSFWKQAELSL